MATKKKGSKGRRRPPSRPSSAAAAKPSPKPAAQAGASAAEQSTTRDQAAKQAAKQPAKAAPAKAKGDRTTPTRAERIEAARRARQRKQVLTRVAVVGTVVVLVGVVAWIVVGNRQERSATIASMEKASCEYDEEADDDGGTGRNHVTSGSPSYETNPPSGGNHLASPSPPGQFTTDQIPQDGNVVHSMEHGYVVLWYKPDLGEEGVNQLKTLADKYSKDVLLVPRPSMEEPVAATTWHRRLLCENLEPEALETFITEYRNKGPEKVPHE